jgi:hypothetical protein
VGRRGEGATLIKKLIFIFYILLILQAVE